MPNPFEGLRPASSRDHAAWVVEAMAGAMREMLGARDVSFLIADFSGRSLNRLGHTDDANGRGEETAGTVALDGTPYGEALASQRTVLLREGDGTRMIAPAPNARH